MITLLGRIPNYENPEYKFKIKTYIPGFSPVFRQNIFLCNKFATNNMIKFY